MMSEILKSAWAKSPLLVYPLVSLVIFLTMFAFVVAFVVRRGRALETHASMPLDEDKP
jgi:hypothetical protein